MKRIDGMQGSIDAGLEELKTKTESERIRFLRVTRTTSKAMTIYYDKLSDEQKQELDRIDILLFEMADEVTQEITTHLKGK